MRKKEVDLATVAHGNGEGWKEPAAEEDDSLVLFWEAWGAEGQHV